MGRFQAERGDLLLWLQGFLIEESQSGSRPAAARPPVHEVSWLPARPAGRPSSSRHAVTPETDPATGAGTLRGLRRDLLLEQAWRGAGFRQVTLLAMRIEPATPATGTANPEALLRAVVDGGRRALRERDRFYRTGPSEISVLLLGADDIGAEIAVARLAAATKPILAACGLPGIRIKTKAIDPALVVDAAKTGARSARPATRPAVAAG